ncbi:hypothetical protein TSUD_195120 [Trifolium subterraneum]|nr:hypothetical protein TSUD_195120 [Trifolium subterraneum]
MLVDRDSLWFRVLAACYGVERGRVREGGRVERVFVVAGTPLCERFERLFDLAEVKSATVAEMFALGWGAGGESWVWRRPLRGWEEEELRECYSVRGAYHLLTSHDYVTLDDAAGLIWHTQWRLITVYLVVAWPNIRNTYSYLVALLVLSGHLLILGLAPLWWTLIHYKITFCSLLLRDCSEAPQTRYIICWTRSSYSLIGG